MSNANASVNTSAHNQLDTASNVDAPPVPDNLRRFQVVCESRALLWQLDDLEFHDAVDVCLARAARLGIDPDVAQAIMAQAFGAVREEP